MQSNEFQLRQEIVKIGHIQNLGLGRPGAAEDFCQICGLCHPEGIHLNNVVTTQYDNHIREIVAEVVRKTMGN